MGKLRVIARNSRLSKIQVAEVFELYNKIDYELIFTESWGDRHKDVSLYEMQGYDHGAMPHPAYHILKNEIKRIAK